MSERIVKFHHDERGIVKTWDEVGELIRCKDCKHRPTINGEYEDGFDLEFPTNRCPCQCDDGWYNWLPDDEWYCANGERKEE